MPTAILLYRWFAATYHWTPAQVDDLDLDHVDWLQVIERAEAEAQHIMSKPKPQPHFSGGAGGFG